MAEAVNDIVNTPENNLEAMRALREEDIDSSNGISYRNGRFYKGNMEVVSDNSDELPDEEPSLEDIVSFVSLNDTAVTVQSPVLLVVTGTFAESDTAVTSSESALVPVIPLSAELIDDEVPVDD